MTRQEVEREMASAECDLALAMARFKELNAELQEAEQWVSAAIEREEAARKDFDALPYRPLIAEEGRRS